MEALKILQELLSCMGKSAASQLPTIMGSAWRLFEAAPPVFEALVIPNGDDGRDTTTGSGDGVASAAGGSKDGGSARVTPPEAGDSSPFMREGDVTFETVVEQLYEFLLTVQGSAALQPQLKGALRQVVYNTICFMQVCMHAAPSLSLLFFHFVIQCACCQFHRRRSVACRAEARHLLITFHVFLLSVFHHSHDVYVRPVYLPYCSSAIVRPAPIASVSASVSAMVIFVLSNCACLCFPEGHPGRPATANRCGFVGGGVPDCAQHVLHTAVMVPLWLVCVPASCQQAGFDQLEGRDVLLCLSATLPLAMQHCLWRCSAACNSRRAITVVRVLLVRPCGQRHSLAAPGGCGRLASISSGQSRMLSQRGVTHFGSARGNCNRSTHLWLAKSHQCRLGSAHTSATVPFHSTQTCQRQHVRTRCMTRTLLSASAWLLRITLASWGHQLYWRFPSVFQTCVFSGICDLVRMLPLAV